MNGNGVCRARRVSAGLFRRPWRAVPGVPAGRNLPRISSTFRGRARCTQQRPATRSNTQQAGPEQRIAAVPAGRRPAVT